MLRWWIIEMLSSSWIAYRRRRPYFKECQRNFEAVQVMNHKMFAWRNCSSRGGALLALAFSLLDILKKRVEEGCETSPGSLWRSRRSAFTTLCTYGVRWTVGGLSRRLDVALSLRYPFTNILMRMKKNQLTTQFDMMSYQQHDLIFMPPFHIMQGE